MIIIISFSLSLSTTLWFFYFTTFIIIILSMIIIINHHHHHHHHHHHRHHHYHHHYPPHHHHQSSSLYSSLLIIISINIVTASRVIRPHTVPHTSHCMFLADHSLGPCPCHHGTIKDSYGYGFGYHHVTIGTSSTSSPAWRTNHQNILVSLDSLGFLARPGHWNPRFPFDSWPPVSHQGTQPPTFPNQKLPKVIYFLKMKVKNKDMATTLGVQPGKPISKCKVAELSDKTYEWIPYHWNHEATAPAH